MTRVYVAGPMTGIADFNYPAFHAAADQWRELGYEVSNPADHDLAFANAHAGEHDLIRAHYLALDIGMVVEADAVAVLKGWQESQGALVEVHIAQVMGKPVLDAETGQPYHESATAEAERLVHGQRGKAYGHPADDFGRTGRMWGAILGIPDVPPEKVGLCMAAVKISREVNKHGRDNLVDLAGYGETVLMIHERNASV